MKHVDDSRWAEPSRRRQPFARVQIDKPEVSEVLDIVFEYLQEEGLIPLDITTPEWKCSHPELLDRVQGEIQNMAEDSTEIHYD